MPQFPLSIRLIVVGKMRGSIFEAASRAYLERLQHYVEIELVEIKTLLDKGKAEAQAIILEGRELQKHFRVEARQIALHASGRELGSADFARRLQRLTETGTRKIDLIIGGAAGLSQEILQTAHESLSLSKLTFAHELARVVLLEQLYRACTIWRGEKYHK